MMQQLKEIDKVISIKEDGKGVSGSINKPGTETTIYLYKDGTYAVKVNEYEK